MSNDDCGGMNEDQKEACHNILYKVIPQGTKSMKTAEVLESREKVYIRFEHPEIWPIIKEWLKTEGIQ